MVLILVAPSLLAASIYMDLGRIIRLTRCEHLSIIRVGWLTKLFVVGDIVAFLTQAFGMCYCDTTTVYPALLVVEDDSR